MVLLIQAFFTSNSSGNLAAEKDPTSSNKLRNAIELNLDVKVMRYSDSPEDSETFSSETRELYKCTRV